MVSRMFPGPIGARVAKEGACGIKPERQPSYNWYGKTAYRREPRRPRNAATVRRTRARALRRRGAFSSGEHPGKLATFGNEFLEKKGAVATTHWRLALAVAARLLSFR